MPATIKFYFQFSKYFEPLDLSPIREDQNNLIIKLSFLSGCLNIVFFYQVSQELKCNHF